MRSPSMPSLVLQVLALATLLLPSGVAAQKPEKSFSAVVTDAEGLETEVNNLQFYWEEKVSETAFVPHQLKQVPVKRGSATINVRFETIKHLEVKPDGPGLPRVTITLKNGKTGDFGLAISGSFKGESDFGEVELPVTGLRKVEFR